MPDELTAVRTPATFRARAAARIPQTTVALVAGRLAGFVVVHDDELEQVYVDAAHRGSGVAPALMEAGLRQVARAGHQRAWLAVAAGNARARRFYEREGWQDDGLFDYAAEGPDGPIVVPNHRMVRSVAAGARRDLRTGAAPRGRLVPADVGVAGHGDPARRPGAPDRDVDLLPAAGG